MLGLNDATELSEQVWHTLPSRVELPASAMAALGKESADSARADCNRQYARRVYQKPVILIDGDTRHACFTKDLSRKGFGFYAPLHFLPRRIIRVWLPGGEVLAARVTRCRRLSERCYEVGANFCAAE